MPRKNLAAAVALGRRGGKVTSEAKRAAVRANGRLGGRPRLCRCCREPFKRAASDAIDPNEYCSAACERGELA